MKWGILFTIIASLFGCATIDQNFSTRTYAVYKQLQYRTDTLKMEDVFGLISLTDSSIIFPDTTYSIEFEGCRSFHCVFRNDLVLFDLDERDPSITAYSNYVEMQIKEINDTNRITSMVYGVSNPIPNREPLIYYKLKHKYYEHSTRQYQYFNRRNQ